MGLEILDVMFRGICVGVAASITVGPVAVLCIQRTLSKSRRSGIVSGVGVACADTFMAMAALFFYSMLQTQIEQYNTLLRVIGGIFVVIVGVYIFAQNPVPQIRRNRAGKTSLWQDFASIFGLTIANFIMVIPYILAFFAVFKISGGDITHAIPDNTGYITEGQLFLRNDSDTGKVIVDPFRSLSRLKQLVIGKKTREDHPQVMNAAVRLYADAANAKTKLENGFDLSDYDERALKFAYDYSEKLLAIDVNIEITQMLDTAWELFAKYFSKEEVAIKSELVEKYWPKTE